MEFIETFATIRFDFRNNQSSQTNPSHYSIPSLSLQLRIRHGFRTRDQKRSIQKGKTSVVNVEKAPNGIRIAELFENPKAYLNKQVIIKGQVVKVNNGVMQVNFVHLQDGSTGNGKYDITITTNDEFKIGEVVTIKGTVILNKDFGAGYVYDVLIEKAVILF